MKGRPTYTIEPSIGLKCSECLMLGILSAEGIKACDWLHGAAYPEIDACQEHNWQSTNPKLRLIDGKPHRKRRGKWVEIPAEWFGHKLDKQTRRKRNTVSRRTRKSKKDES